MQQKSIGEKMIRITVGIVGLVAVFFLGKWISTQIYHRPDAETEVRSEPDGALQAAQAALTEEEL